MTCGTVSTMSKERTRTAQKGIAARQPAMDQRARLHIFLAELARAPGLAGRALVQVYRHTLAPLVGYECRHLPTCSAYADEAIGRFGLWAGGWMTLARLSRCHPLGTSGLDFVPAALPTHARWYLPWRYGRWRGTNDAI